MHGLAGVMRALLEHGADANEADPHDGPLLHRAAAFGEPELTEVLLSAGASVSAVFDGCTALHEAAVAGNSEVVRLLLEAGADPRLKDDEGTTAIDLAEDPSVRSLLEGWTGKGGKP